MGPQTAPGYCALAFSGANLTFRMKSGTRFAGKRFLGRRGYRDGPKTVSSRGGELVLAEADEREMPERRHRLTLDQPKPLGALHPGGEPPPGKFRPPSELARDRGKALLEDAAQSGLGPDMVDQDDLAAGLEHAREFVERGLRVRHRG